jgi:hypothetical protein
VVEAKILVEVDVEVLIDVEEELVEEVVEEVVEVVISKVDVVTSSVTLSSMQPGRNTNKTRKNTTAIRNKPFEVIRR